MKQGLPNQQNKPTPRPRCWIFAGFPLNSNLASVPFKFTLNSEFTTQQSQAKTNQVGHILEEKRAAREFVICMIEIELAIYTI